MLPEAVPGVKKQRWQSSNHGNQPISIKLYVVVVLTTELGSRWSACLKH
jgi:hypothetical protein